MCSRGEIEARDMRRGAAVREARVREARVREEEAKEEKGMGGCGEGGEVEEAVRWWGRARLVRVE